MWVLFWHYLYLFICIAHTILSSLCVIYGMNIVVTNAYLQCFQQVLKGIRYLYFRTLCVIFDFVYHSAGMARAERTSWLQR